LFQIKAALDEAIYLISTSSHTKGQTENDWITPNFSAAGIDHCGWRCRGIDCRRSSRHRFVDAGACSEGATEGGEISGHAEG
jgi:hypothetical protein